MVALELENLGKEWPAMKVQVDLKVEPGNLVALAGPSGCGKSTVLRMIAGLCPPDSGKVWIDGNDVTTLSPRDREVGMVFQDYALFPHMDVLSNVAYGLAFRGINRKTREALSLDILDSVGMRSFAKRRPHELSGGEKQRVALARTIATRPRVVLFDEPLSSLDSVLRKHLRMEIREQQRRFGLTSIYVTHDMEEAMAMADKVAVMDNGMILQCSPPRELWFKPDSVAVARFLGSGPCIPVEKYESSKDAMIATTESGRFGLKDKTTHHHRQDFTELNTTATATSKVFNTKASETFLFFERTAARPVSQAEAAQIRIQDGFGLFTATCIRTDFAGDVADCIFQAGHETIPLRLSMEKAPVPGEQVQFTVDTEKIHIIIQ